MQKDVKRFTTKVGDSLQIDRQFIRCYKYDERQDNQSEMVFWIFLLRQVRLEHLEMCSHVHFPASYGLNHIKEGV